MADFLSYLWKQLVPATVAVVSFVASVITIIQTIKSKTKLSRKLFFISLAIFVVSFFYLAYKYTSPNPPIGNTMVSSTTNNPIGNVLQQPTDSSDNPPQTSTTTSRSSSDPTHASNGGKMQVVEGAGSIFVDEAIETTVTTGDGGTSVTNIGDGNINIIGSNNTIGSIEPDIPVVTVTKVTLDRKSADLYVDEDLDLTATVFYSNNESEKNGSAVKWESSNTSVADVDQNGHVRLHGPGTSEITVQASINNSAQSDTCIVSVKERVTPPSGYTILLSSSTATLGSSFRIYITPYEADATEIWVHAKAPSGAEDAYLWNKDQPYEIETETGIWTIWATIKNEAGAYEANKPEDFATIEITPLNFDQFFP